MSKKVMCFGSFDLFHAGHEFYISESSQYGDVLYVVVARNSSIEKIKGNPPLFSEQVRMKEIEKHFPKAKVILGDDKDFFKCLRIYKPDTLCFGYDQKVNEAEIHSQFPHIQIVRIHSFQEDTYKSSLLKKQL